MTRFIRRPRRRTAGAVALVLGLAFIIGGVMAAVAARSVAPTRAASATYAAALDAREPLATVTEPRPASVVTGAREPVEEPASSEPLYPAPVERISIPAIGVDSALVALNITPDGYMDAPRDPELVGWYDFTAKPGLGGNAVFSGHVDWRNYGPAVFWDLAKLVPGDEIHVSLRDGTRISYAVTGSASHDLESIDMAAVLASTTNESVTLITCDGTFSGGSYDHRLIVRAIRTGVQPAS